MADEKESSTAASSSFSGSSPAKSKESAAKASDDPFAEREVVVGETVRYTGENGIALDAVVTKLDGKDVDVHGALNVHQTFEDVPYDALGSPHTWSFKQYVPLIIHGKPTEVGHSVHYTDANGRVHTATITRLDENRADLETEPVPSQKHTGVAHSANGSVHTWNHA